MESFQAGRPAGSSRERKARQDRERIRKPAGPPQTRHKERLEAHGKEEQSRKDQDCIPGNEQQRDAAASREAGRDQAGPEEYERCVIENVSH